MNKILFFSVLSIFLGVVGINPDHEAIAKDLGDTYISFDYLIVPYNQLGKGDHIVSGLRYRAGLYLFPYISVEAGAGSGILDHRETGDFGGYDAIIDMELDYMFGFYIRGEYPLSELLNIYVIFGYTKAKVSGTLSLREYDDYSPKDIRTDAALSYGAGIEILIHKKFAIDIEYLENADKTELDVRAFVVGLKMYF